MELERGLALIRYSLLCINYTCKSPVFRNNRNNLSLSENCNCKHNITIHQLFQMERSRLREGSSLFDHILIGKSLHYRFGLWTLLPLITLQVIFTSCLFKEYLCLTHLSSQSPTSFWRRACRRVLWKDTMSPPTTLLKTQNGQNIAVIYKSFINCEPSGLAFGKPLLPKRPVFGKGVKGQSQF